MWLMGTPTIMFGDIEDANFEEHLKEGPYVVFDDSARDEYKNDSRVYFIKGHPVLQTALPELMKGLGVEFAGTSMMKWQEFERWGMHNLEYGTSKRRVMTVAKPLVVAGLAVAGIYALTSLVKKIINKSAQS
jgi:hypothetical protein